MSGSFVKNRWQRMYTQMQIVDKFGGGWMLNSVFIVSIFSVK